jgi:N6-L-threonylcarbamoyladenine synthase
MATILGIESTCDETSFAVIKDNQYLSNVTATSIQDHIQFGGIIPEIASRRHLEVIDSVYRQSLEQAGIEAGEIDAIGVAAYPGLIGSLAVGVSFAKTLSLSLQKPIYAINHVLAHAYIGFDQSTGETTPSTEAATPSLEGELSRAPVIPAKAGISSDITQSEVVASRNDDATVVALVVSGGHTNLFLVNDWVEDVQNIGTTLDDAAGECFDKIGRLFGMDYPAGPTIDKLYYQGNPGAVKFTKPLTAKKFDENHRFDFSFSGLKTQVINFKKNNPNVPVNDILASFQETATEVLVEKTVKALEQYKVNHLVVGGGFSANSTLRSKLQLKSKELGFRLSIPETKYCTDNGLMIASVANLLYSSNIAPSPLDFSISSSGDLNKIFIS